MAQSGGYNEDRYPQGYPPADPTGAFNNSSYGGTGPRTVAAGRVIEARLGAVAVSGEETLGEAAPLADSGLPFGGVGLSLTATPEAVGIVVLW